MPLTPLQAVQQLQDDVALFAAVMHGTSGDTVDLGDSVVVPTLAGVMAILASNADSVISMEKILASAGQVAGVDDNTEAFAEALSLLGPGKCLMLGSTNYKISDTLALPDNSGWSIMSPGLATVTQTTDNKPIWRMTPTTYRSRFKMRGIAHNWTNDQPSTNTDAIGIAFHVDEDIQNGIYDFELSDLVFDNGFRGIAPDASTISNGYVLPIWGWQIERVTSYTGVKGATIFLGAFGNCGAPRGKLQNFYAQSLNAVEPALILQGMDSIDLDVLEFNSGTNRQLYLNTCRNARINRIRFEQCHQTVNNSELICIAGTNVLAEIDGLHVTYHTINISDHVCFVNAYQSRVRVKDFNIRQLTVTSGGAVAYSPRSGGIIEHCGAPSIEGISGGFSLYSTIDAVSAPAVNFDRQDAHRFTLDAVATSVSYAYCNAGGGAIQGRSASRTGWVTGMWVRADGAFTAGTLTAVLYINGNGVADGGFYVTLDSTHQTGAKYYPMGGTTSFQTWFFNEGDVLDVRVVTSSDLAPNTRNIEAVLEVAYV
ncbi:MAG: hypothetical protein WCA78_00745 [Rhizomicrobium sp.]